MNTFLRLFDTGTEIDRNGVKLRSQNKSDIQALESMLPSDKSYLFRASWEGGSVVFVKVNEPQPSRVLISDKDEAGEEARIAIKARVNALSPTKLKTRAVELGVEIPEGSSNVTIKELVTEAEVKAAAAKEE